MQQFEKYLVKLLQGRIIYDGQVVEVVKNFNQHPDRPVITLDLSGGVTTQRIYNNPGLAEKYIERHSNININVWCDTENQREYITNKILELFKHEQNYHYSYCTRYNPDTQKCSTLNSTCPASSAGASITKNRCPAPVQNNYEALHRHYNIIIGTVNINPPFDMDELNEHPPLLRSILRCEAQYCDYIENSYAPIESIGYDINEA